MKIVLASTNPDKLTEIQALLQPLSHQLVLQADFNIPEVEESGLSFLENALLKARHAAQLTGLPAIADDSGLVVNALHGAPGIYSARYAGPNANATDRNAKLLEAMTGIENRAAYYYTAAVFMLHSEDPTPLIGLGKWSGEILTETRGIYGFGYDPLFYVPERGCTAAELDLNEKNRISHRAIAFNALANQLRL